MQKSIYSFVIALLTILVSCSQADKSKPLEAVSRDSTTFFPVTDFLEGQLKEIESMPVTPLKTITENGKVDSFWVTREDIRGFAKPFLLPEIDSVSMNSYFSGKSFLDATINLITLTYEPKTVLPKDLKLRHWDVYIDPQSGEVQRVYMVKEEWEQDINVTTQLTWNVNKWCSIRSITQKEGSTPEIKEEKMVWKF